MAVALAPFWQRCQAGGWHGTRDGMAVQVSCLPHVRTEKVHAVVITSSRYQFRLFIHE